MDFYRIKQRRGKNNIVEIYPDFRVVRSQDLMVRAKDFYAIWDSEKGLWSTDEFDVQRLVDQSLFEYEKHLKEKTSDATHVMEMGSFSTNSWKNFQMYTKALSDNATQLDTTVTFANTVVRKEDYVSRRLPYSLPDGSGSIDAYDELISVLYDPSNREKLEWAVGAIISGDAAWIQKFIVLYGAAGAGKSTFLNIVQDLFAGYYTTFEAKALTGNNNQFATEAFRGNPLVAIQHDGDLSRIEDNTKLNSIVSHEMMRINEKNKPTYDSKVSAFLFMGTNKPVKITDAKSGIIRRLIDVVPTGERVSPRRYQTLMAQIKFELGAIAKHCLNVYLDRGADYYSGYKPVEMMLQTDVFYNFIESNVSLFLRQNGTSLNQAYELYKAYCEEALVEYKLPRHRFREELKNYFGSFEERKRVDGENIRSWYGEFKRESFDSVIVEPGTEPLSLVLTEHEGDTPFEVFAAGFPAQYAREGDVPSTKWSDVTTTLSDLDQSRVHFVNVPEEASLVVIDFDLKDDSGEKDMERNLIAASKWPKTHAEPSKGGQGIHLHYLYDGDANELARVYDKDIEIKVFTGNASLRRKKTLSNGVQLAKIEPGQLPRKEKKVFDKEGVQSEQHLRAVVEKALRKEVHSGTKPSIDFIHYVLDEAHRAGYDYDLTDMKGSVLSFATGSTNQALYCIKLVQKMEFKSGEEELQSEATKPNDADISNRLVVFDTEVFPNLFVLSWKHHGSEHKPVSLINPTAAEVEALMRFPLIGFNNRKYDNHILYAAMMGYDNESLYRLSQRLVSNDRTGYFGAAYGISYADIYEFSSKKQSLKLFEIELGLVHMELGLPWDQPVPEHLWSKVVEYCENDVIATDAVLVNRWQDLVARRILAELSGLSVNSTTQQHTARIVFGENRKPQADFVYTDLSKEFPGYSWELTKTGVKSTFNGEDVNEGGDVYGEPGVYYDVAVLDVESMHPTSIEQLNVFGKYTKNFSALKQARVAIKHRDYDAARKMLGGKLRPYLDSPENAEALSYALKIVINIVYGLTAASFPNAFKDERNKDNIVAKRGALFMRVLRKYCQEELGVQVIHVKTDSIKIPGATPRIIDAVMEFGHAYGYNFEHEGTYEKLCLVNDAVYIAKTKDGRKPAHWEAVGKQFAEPVVFKTLFTHEPLSLDDYVQTKSVQTALYLDFDYETPLEERTDANKPHFVGRVGGFIPVVEGVGGGRLLRLDKDGVKYHSATGAKGYLWRESTAIKPMGLEDSIDQNFYDRLVNEARKDIGQYCDVDSFLSN